MFCLVVLGTFFHVGSFPVNTKCTLTNNKRKIMDFKQEIPFSAISHLWVIVTQGFFFPPESQIIFGKISFLRKYSVVYKVGVVLPRYYCENVVGYKLARARLQDVENRQRPTYFFKFCYKTYQGASWVGLNSSLHEPCGPGLKIGMSLAWVQVGSGLSHGLKYLKVIFVQRLHFILVKIFTYKNETARN